MLSYTQPVENPAINGLNFCKTDQIPIKQTQQKINNLISKSVQHVTKTFSTHTSAINKDLQNAFQMQGTYHQKITSHFSNNIKNPLNAGLQPLTDLKTSSIKKVSMGINHNRQGLTPDNGINSLKNNTNIFIKPDHHIHATSSKIDVHATKGSPNLKYQAAETLAIEFLKQNYPDVHQKYRITAKDQPESLKSQLVSQVEKSESIGEIADTIVHEATHWASTSMPSKQDEIAAYSIAEQFSDTIGVGTFKNPKEIRAWIDKMYPDLPETADTLRTF